MRKLLSVIIVYLVGWIPMFPCTSAVVSGRVTPDGRPLLWKHRDASDLNNRIVHFEAEGGKLEFVGLVNGVDTMANEVWAGYNTSGFAIMNTASYNLKNDTSSLSDREGVVMKQVLGECRTVEDFARLLDSLPRPIGVEANFGVVDALGGAAYFEVNSYEVFRYDVKDSPDGYLLRTNYSVSGRPNEGYGISVTIMPPGCFHVLPPSAVLLPNGLQAFVPARFITFCWDGILRPMHGWSIRISYLAAVHRLLLSSKA